MKVLDTELDENPTNVKVEKMAETRIRNLQCFEELQSFNDTGKWRNKHPLLVHYSERYKSYMNNDSRVYQRESDKKNLIKHQERKVLFETILKEDERNNYS